MTLSTRLGYRCSLATLPVLVALGVANSGCMSYVTPARGVSMATLVDVDADIRERMTREPAAPFPARLAVARVQEPGYRSYRSHGYGEGRYSVVTARDVETEEDFERIGRLPMVAAVAMLNRLILPAKLESDKELRLAAAALKADILWVYSFDTAFRIDGRDIGPLGLVTLGFLPINDAVVTSTVSAALFDVRTGYVYGLAEASATEKRHASAWTTRDAADHARVAAEREAFSQMLVEFERVWKQVVEQHAAQARVPGALLKDGAEN